jgi:hypothetical protein
MTAQTWIDRTRDLLLSGTVEPINRLNGDMSTSASTLNLEFSAGAVVPGTVIEIGTELLYVTSVSGSLVGALRGYGGSSAASHSTEDIIRVSPQYPAHQILDALNTDLNDLSANGLYQVKTLPEFSYVSGTDGYNLASDALGVYRVTYVDPSSDLSEPEVRRFALRRNRNTATFASGVALILQDIPVSGQMVRVEYKAPFTTLTAASTALTATGLHTEAYDLPVLGAALQLMTFKPIARESITTQSPMRRADEVPSGAISASMRDLRLRRHERIEAEKARLAQLYPTTWLRSGE